MLGSIILTTRLVLVDNDKKSTFSSKELDELPPEKPSILASRMEKYKRDEEWALHTIPLQLL
jgi:hypothetical protein